MRSTTFSLPIEYEPNTHHTLTPALSQYRHLLYASLVSLHPWLPPCTLSVNGCPDAQGRLTELRGWRITAGLLPPPASPMQLVLVPYVPPSRCVHASDWVCGIARDSRTSLHDDGRRASHTRETATHSHHTNRLLCPYCPCDAGMSGGRSAGERTGRARNRVEV